jgi:hypothetical protein
LGGVLYLLAGNKSAAAYTTLSYGRLDVDCSGLAIIIRDETVYSAPAYGKTVQLAASGTYVEKNEPIAVIYKESFDEDIVRQLYDIQEKIVLYQQEQLMDQVVDSDIKKMNNDIQDMICSIQGSIRNKEYTKLGKLESRLRKTLDNRQVLLDYQTEPDPYLTGLYDKEAKLMAKMKEWMVEIESPEAGLVCFSIDGYEEVLGISSVDKLTFEDINLILEQYSTTVTPHVNEADKADEAAKDAEVQALHPFYRIVNPGSDWYAVLQFTSSKQIFFNPGDTVDAIIGGQEAVQAVVSQVIKGEDQYIIILKFSANAELVANNRVYPLQIWKTVEGLMVPEKALKKNKGMQGVYIRDGQDNIFVETSVQALANGFAIVESVSDNLVLQLHDQVLTDND